MNQLLISGKSRYEQNRDESLIVMPASEGLLRTKQQQKICVGDCIVLYEKQLLLRGEWKEEVGQLICDEMKLKGDILFNVKSNKMVGFTEDFISTKKVIKNLLDEDKIDNFCGPAKNVNQWRYRSINGRSFNCEFWFNSGHLDGDTLLQQFNQVVIHCEIIGSRVMGFVCDAGGSNAGLMKLLRGRTRIPEGSWLPIDSVRTPNPYDPSRFIYLYHCSTHNMKNMRGALFMSTPGGKKQFLDVNDNIISKAIIEECRDRDKARQTNNHAPATRVTGITTNLNKWSVMNVSQAKRISEEKTLAESGCHIYGLLGVPVDEQLKQERYHLGHFLLKREKEDPLHPTEKRPLGYWPAVAIHFKDILKKKLQDDQFAGSENWEVLASKISSFEWLANLHEIFNATLMNMDIVIGRWNIDRYVLYSCILIVTYNTI